MTRAALDTLAGLVGFRLDPGGWLPDWDPRTTVHAVVRYRWSPADIDTAPWRITVGARYYCGYFRGVEAEVAYGTPSRPPHVVEYRIAPSLRPAVEVAAEAIDHAEAIATRLGLTWPLAFAVARQELGRAADGRAA